MKLAIMQPYLFPYLGYFQLVGAVDKFVFFDDVNFKVRGWINRNRLLVGGEVRYFTVPLSDASQSKKINEIFIHDDDTWRKKLFSSIRQSYRKAPNFTAANELVSEILSSDERRISVLAANSVTTISEYLGLPTRFVMSSSCYGNADLKGTDRILDICLREQATHYFNLPGGKELYEEELFESNGLNLRFIDPRLPAYRQFTDDFHPGLSIIDVLMFNDREAVKNMLHALPAN